jgi:hypothetical protein
VVIAIVAVEHAADEVRDHVLSQSGLIFELAEQIKIECFFLLGGDELRVLVDPALVALQCGDLLLP